MNEGGVDRARILWWAHLAKSPQLQTLVKPGFMPATSYCLYARPECFHATFKRLDCADKKHAAERCVASGMTR